MAINNTRFARVRLPVFTSKKVIGAASKTGRAERNRGLLPVRNAINSEPAKSTAAKALSRQVVGVFRSESGGSGFGFKFMIAPCSGIGLIFQSRPARVPVP